MLLTRRRLAAPGGALALLALICAGCGSGTTTVSGRVTYQGKPIPGGSIVLYCADKQIVHAILGADGTYTIPDVPRGEAVITIQTPQPKPYMIKHRLNLPPAVNGPAPAVVEPARGEEVVQLPLRYTLPEESGLTVMVEGKNLTHDIDLRP
jgi:hypothetical protein